MELYSAPAEFAKRPVYFSATDGYSNQPPPATLARSLIYNLLFQEGGLMIPDSFFLNSDPLIRYLANETAPVVFRALEQGLIIPSFRDGRASSFAEAFGTVSEGNIRGISESIFSRHGTTQWEIASKLDEAVQKSEGNTVSSRLRPRRQVWPENMGERFAALLESTLQRDDLGSPYDPSYAQLWRETAPWRGDLLDRARQQTRVIGGVGIRRAEVLDLIGRELGYLDKGASFVRSNDLAEAARGDFLMARRLTFFTGVINAIYHRSQAIGFGAVPNTLSALTPIATSIFGANSAVASRSTPDRPLVLKLVLPSVADLLRADSARLLAVRESDEGQKYFRARARWIQGQSGDPDCRARLSEAARSYAASVRKEVGGQLNPFAVCIFTSGAYLALAELVKAGVGFLADAEKLHPAYGLVAGAAAGGVMAFMEYSNRRRARVAIPHPPPEANI